MTNTQSQISVTQESFSTFIKGETILKLEGTYQHPNYWVTKIGIYAGLTEDGKSVQLIRKSEEDLDTTPLEQIKEVESLSVFQVVTHLHDLWWAQFI